MSKATSLWIIAVFLVILFFIQPLDIIFLRYERSTFPAEIWQSLSHVLIHLNYTHLTLNGVALLLIFLLFPSAFESREWIVALILSAITTSTGLYLFSPDVAWCVGLSGALHGLFVYAIFKSSAHWLWAVAIVAKIVYEQIPALQSNPNLQFTSKLISGDVVVDAHLWGALGGLLVVIVKLILNLSTYAEIARR